jgi:hypothetical protein
VIPEALFGLFGDGGTTVFVPGGAVTFTLDLGSPELVFALGYASYAMGETAFKPSDTPDTDYEILESDMGALAATVDVMWTVPFDDEARWALRFGGSVGVGWMFHGDLTRTQAYPPSGRAGDPDDYHKCNGPNDPVGSFRYCNQLDADADHYDGYSEPNWFAGGSRPLIFPWLALPVGVRYRPLETLALDLEAGVSIVGVVMTFGARFGL